MKKASELGLELIELEDQVLLVDSLKSRVYGDYYVLRNAWGLNSHEVTQWTEAKHSLLSGKKSNPTGVIIASTKQLEGIPLLVIEDEVEKVFYQDNILDKEVAQHFFPLFKEGYNKARETYKFTEDNLLVIRNKFVQLLPIGDINAWDLIKSIQKYTEWFDKYIQSLTKKELWIEVELIPVYDNHGGGNIFESDKKEVIRITQGKIKAVWK